MASTRLAPAPLQVTASDRLGLTLFLAISLHALVLLGISFQSEDPSRPDVISTLDITIAQVETPKPKEADYLAQADQSGGGNTQERVRHVSPHAQNSPDAQRGQDDRSQSPVKAAPTPAQQTQVLTRKQSDLQVAPAEQEPEARTTSKLSVQELLRRSKQIAQLSAKNDAMWQAYAKRPDAKYLHANTQSQVDAAYLAAWSRKVEEIGNLNYPREASRRNLTGNLILEATLRPDGSLISIRILRSSQYKVLDDAAIDIVKLAAPYAAVPAEVLQGKKVLRIVRTWSYTSENRLHSR